MRAINTSSPPLPRCGLGGSWADSCCAPAAALTVVQGRVALSDSDERVFSFEDRPASALADGPASALADGPASTLEARLSTIADHHAETTRGSGCQHDNEWVWGAATCADGHLTAVGDHCSGENCGQGARCDECASTAVEAVAVAYTTCTFIYMGDLRDQLSTRRSALGTAVPLTSRLAKGSAPS